MVSPSALTPGSPAGVTRGLTFHESAPVVRSCHTWSHHGVPCVGPGPLLCMFFCPQSLPLPEALGHPPALVVIANILCAPQSPLSRGRAAIGTLQGLPGRTINAQQKTERGKLTSLVKRERGSLPPQLLLCICS